MSIYYLIPIIIVLGVIVYYIYYIAPRINPHTKADNFLSQNMIDEAILEYKRILNQDPGNFIVHYKLGKIYFDLENIDQGIFHFNEIMKKNKFSFEVEKIDVMRKLAESYLIIDDLENAFQYYFNIVNIYPNDQEALYHVSFMSLGQELFEISKKYFDRLVKVSKMNFKILFGAGMASYQEQNNNQAYEYFKEALVHDPHSDIGNLSIAFALQRKRDFKAAVNYLRMLIDNTDDINAGFIARRLMGVVQVQWGMYAEALKSFQGLMDFSNKNDLKEEEATIFFDLGFASLKAEKTEQAYEYWNQAYQIDRGLKNVQKLITILRKEMDISTTKVPDPNRESAEDYVEHWIRNSFPENFIWEICGLKSNEKINMRNIRTVTRVSTGKSPVAAVKEGGSIFSDSSETLEKYFDADLEKFRLISSRVALKLGYNVDEILNTYKESDGVDLMARSLANDSKTLIWVRRWKGTRVGEIPLRNFAQAINDVKAAEGLLITTSELNGPAESALKRLSRVKVVNPEQLREILVGII